MESMTVLKPVTGPWRYLPFGSSLQVQEEVLFEDEWCATEYVYPAVVVRGEIQGVYEDRDCAFVLSERPRHSDQPFPANEHPEFIFPDTFRADGDTGPLRRYVLRLEVTFSPNALEAVPQ